MAVYLIVTDATKSLANYTENVSVGSLLVLNIKAFVPSAPNVCHCFDFESVMVFAALAVIRADGCISTLDPFCGDDTVAIETKILHQQISVIASDIDQMRVSNTVKNAKKLELILRFAAETLQK